MGTVRILYMAGTISLQAVAYPGHRLGALNMKEEEEVMTFASLQEVLVSYFDLEAEIV